jgi:hypothetical protein
MKNSNKHHRAKKSVAKKLSFFRPPGAEPSGNILKDIKMPSFIHNPLDVAAVRTMLRQQGLRVEKRAGRWEIIEPPKKT